MERKHSHYYKRCPYDEIDVYRLLELFDITDQTIGHAVKKLLVAGGRGYKDISKDIQDVIDTLERWKEMREEEFVVENRESDVRRELSNDPFMGFSRELSTIRPRNKREINDYALKEEAFLNDMYCDDKN